MIYKNHNLEIYINGSLADISADINIRLNNVLFNPEEISSKNAEYSFEFELPATPNNNKVFNYANNLSKVNKFHYKWKCDVYIDSVKLFTGSLILKAFSKGNYKCNLVEVKKYSLEDIFGETKLSDIDWKIDFDGIETINYLNYHLSPVKFPLVSYGAFQKKPFNSDEVANDYTSKFVMDEYNKWWVQSFYPSLSVIETVKKCFEKKGYELAGDVVVDPTLTDIYMSTTLANEQSPDYNIGNPLFGELNLSFTFNNNSQNNGMFYQDLTYPYFEVKDFPNSVTSGQGQSQYNVAEVNLWNVLNTTSNPNASFTISNKSYMFDPTEHLIVIPADGWYKIYLEANATMTTTSAFNADQWYASCHGNFDEAVKKEQISITPNIKESCFVELQLVKNYDDNLELIKGKNNKFYWNGNPNDSVYRYSSDTYSSKYRSNIEEWQTEFPHQALMASENPTKENDLIIATKSTDYQPKGNSFGASYAKNYVTDLGYMHKDTETMVYDQAVSPAFICGFSSFLGPTVAVARNGYSWSKAYNSKNQILANVTGYDLIKPDGNGTRKESSNYCANTYPLAARDIAGLSSNSLNGSVNCLVYLNKNDVLELMLVQRDYDGQKYTTSLNGTLQIKAISNRSEAELRGDATFNAFSPTEFETKLNLGNFCDKEAEMKTFVQDVINSFNLDLTQDGKTIYLNKKKIPFKQPHLGKVNIDDRVNTYDVEASRINYPSSMAVKYKIDTEEWGFETTVPNDKIESENWEQYGDSGFSTITLSDDIYDTSESNVDTNHSYTWYDSFTWYQVDSAHTIDKSVSKTLRIPVLSKATYMIDGYDYDEAMKHDGYSLTKRLWFKPKAVENCYVWSSSYPTEKIDIYVPSNVNDNGLNLSYKINEKSLLTEYFGVNAYLSSNYVTVNVYLNPMEYNMLKNGAMVILDTDAYYVCEITGYDALGNNPTELKLIKKIN